MIEGAPLVLLAKEHPDVIELHQHTYTQKKSLSPQVFAL